MQAFTTVHGVAAPLPTVNVDTDVIIRIDRLTRLPREELGRYAFESLRYSADGSENREFPLNQPAFKDAQILVAGANFGCGSSREAAVWALYGLGLRCVIAPSFGDIFYDNCFQNGLLPVKLDGATVEHLLALAARGTRFGVDLAGQTVVAGDFSARFEIDAWRKDVLIQGLDSVDYTMRSQDQIQAWQVRDRCVRPWVWPSQG